MHNLVEFITLALAGHPEVVKVESESNEQGALFITIVVHPEDVGRIIGRNGRVIQAIRTLVAIIAARENITALVRVRGEVAEENQEELLS